MKIELYQALRTYPKTIIRFELAVRPCVRTRRINLLNWKAFSQKLIFWNFTKHLEKLHDSLNSDKYNGYITQTQTYIHDNIATNSS